MFFVSSVALSVWCIFAHEGQYFMKHVIKAGFFGEDEYGRKVDRVPGVEMQFLRIC